MSVLCIWPESIRYGSRLTIRLQPETPYDTVYGQRGDLSLVDIASKESEYIQIPISMILSQPSLYVNLLTF